MLTLEAKPHTHTVQGKSLSFYPLSLRVMLKLKDVALPMVKSLAVLFADHNKDISQKIVRQEDIEATEITAIDPSLAKERHAQSQEALSSLAQMLFDEHTSLAVAHVIMDSLHDEYPGAEHTDADARDFIKTPNLTIDVVTEILVGVASANKGVLDPLGIPRLLEALSLRFGVANLPGADGSELPEGEELTLVPKENQQQ